MAVEINQGIVGEGVQENLSGELRLDGWEHDGLVLGASFYLSDSPLFLLENSRSLSKQNRCGTDR